MTHHFFWLLVALLVTGCSRPPAGPVRDAADPTPAPAPPPAEAPQALPPASEPPQATQPALLVEPWLVVRTARLDRLEKQAEIHRFKAAQGRIALSPDGRYLHFSSCEPCDERRLYRPEILDRTTGKVVSGSAIVQGLPGFREITWSDGGFWTEPLVQVRTDGTVETNDRLRTLLVPEGWELAAAEVSPDGRTVAVAINQPRYNESGVPMEVVVARRDGTVIGRYPEAFRAVTGQHGPPVGIAWAPDSGRLVACGMTCALIDPAQPVPAVLQVQITKGPVTWSPTGTHLLFPGSGVSDLQGRLVLPLPEPGVRWNAGGTGLLLDGEQTEEIGLDGSRVSHGALGGRIVGWLPDGTAVLVAPTEAP